ncbi:hypothetical protein P167DRAFT_524214 [Morchella conica CCBAS932]|uniref:Uncharacterized protein n=1 Tax=Morchella conica CCBAS932 TaxID=1392247 RepID=A0A3N4KLJ5_9PEZI|nr:hypothetical protein P167DRAFT_524214 [Morchella conica CCBAS932]
MKLLSLSLLFFTAVLGKEISNPARQLKYVSGEVHRTIMKNKNTSFDKSRAEGLFNSSTYPKIDTYTPCVDGYAGSGINTTFRCNNIDLRYFVPHVELGSATGEGSSSWGWTSDDGREFIIIGQADGAAFAEVTEDGALDYIGRLPNTKGSDAIIWREIRVLKHYAVIGSEAEYHGVQIFDLKKLIELKPSRDEPCTSPKVFDPETDVTGMFRDLPIGASHNIVINEDFGYAVSVGARPRNSTCASGLIFIDLSDPTNPTSPGCAAQDGYVHDAQCLEYKGPDTKYLGHDICYGYNEDTLTIYDVTDKKNSTIISRTSYEGAQYTHQGALLDTEWQEFLLMDDEYDEYEMSGLAADGFPVTFIWNISSLERPLQTGYYKSDTRSIDHNQYIKNGFSFQSNYGAGLRILDVSSIPEDPTGAGVKEVGFFDVYPEDDAIGGLVDFVGTWSSYGLFESGWIVINTIERGVFVVRMQDNHYGDGWGEDEDGEGTDGENTDGEDDDGEDDYNGQNKISKGW